ncbi:hypothetical protein MPTK1_1g24700 [Marchantia polymorpha subsp. ruderalis]|uniref:Uncharacterized protein n=2 Tax=Marchantia polymorpha TaxID=3197 RepID=A0AAF6ATX5_MARPO|nr:hypothetical protein MARPO_0061s0051 [Marchantia polymorpha]BBM99895.1 hypothetical protein Mp_1g24700 [Marchantia polymorpha subsp. ruderalis]|eukprot:PTQ36789.1 hypothetical protein MARPO_0061s0051 [Marchantia polymorpha]
MVVPLSLIRRSCVSSSVGAGRNCAQQLRSLSTTVSTNASAPAGEAAPVAAAAAKKSRGGGLLLLLVGAGAAAGVGVWAYPQLVTSPPATHPAPLPSPPTNPPVVPAAATAASPALDADPPAPKPKSLSPREELDQRVSILKDELTALRKQKRSKLVDMKKRSIKDEIRMIETGIAKIEKA